MLNLFSPLPVLPDVPAEKDIWIEKLTELLSCARSESVEGPVAEAEALYYFDSITSTNDHMRKLAMQGAPHGSLVVAEEQTAGRGRHGREWFSPPGSGLYSSLLLRPALGIQRVGWLTLAAALAMVRTAKDAGIALDIKWPNDLECEGRKVAGILAETVTEGNWIRFIVLGTGINVNWEHEKVPDEIRDSATALSSLTHEPLNRDRFLAGYLWELSVIVSNLESDKFSVLPAVANEVMAHLAYLGEHVRITTGEGEESGIFTGLTEEGYLQLDGGRMVVTGELMTKTGETD